MRGPGTQEPERRLSIIGACLNNLRDVDLPLERLICVTGVSGSGKSICIGFQRLSLFTTGAQMVEPEWVARLGTRP